MPSAFFTRGRGDGVTRTLQQGLYGWQVADCVVTMTHSGYCAAAEPRPRTFDKCMSSTAGDFRHLTPLVLMAAPWPEPAPGCASRCTGSGWNARPTAVGALLPVLGRLGAMPDVPTIDGPNALLEGVLPASEVHRLTQQLPGLTSGEGLLESAFDHYREIRGPVPLSPCADTRGRSAAPGSP